MRLREKLLYRKIKDHGFKMMIFFFSFAMTIPLVMIFYYIIEKGIHSINWDFIINLPAPVGELGGGINNAIIGTFLLIFLAVLMSVPLGIATGIYLSEYREGRWAYGIRLGVEILQGVPSIVIGLIAYIWVVRTMKTFSAFSGGVALALMMLPVIIRSTEETLNLVPHSLKEASLALGVPYYRTIIKVIVPTGMSGIITGILISIARVSGETAPLLFTAFGNQFMNYNILKPINSLPHVIFNYATSPYPEWHALAWGASLILIVFVLILNLIAKIGMRRWNVRF